MCLNTDIMNASLPDEIVEDQSCDENSGKHARANTDAQSQRKAFYRTGSERE